MKIVIVGAGQVGSTVVEALHDEHDLTVIDLEPSRLAAISYRYDVTTVEGNGASRSILQEAGVERADLLIACTSRDESNLIAAMFARKLAPETKVVVRTTDEEYLEVWRERQLDVDLIVSSERETAHAISRIIGVPAARQTDVFADGQVQIVEFDVEPAAGELIDEPLRDAPIPRDSKVACIIREQRMVIPRGGEQLRVGDRVIVIGSPQAAREWSRIMSADRKQRVDDVVIFGAGRIGLSVARMLIAQQVRVRLIESDAERARAVAAKFPTARVFHATGVDPDFLERERIGNARAAIFAMRDDAKNHYAATLAKLHGVDFTIAVVHEKISEEVFEEAGIDVVVNPRQVTAEELVRFAHDPRTQQVAMLEGDRYEVLDVRVRPESELANRRFGDMPITGALIGAVIRSGRAIFPHRDDVLEPGDRVIVFSESERAAEVERTL
ncbi:MAG TPA: Trk system potassium transporter TrkA [Gaiellaceae bacterium]|nr:Trk system potassium transporter TrkA [Gaiellaceae bacterium]